MKYFIRAWTNLSPSGRASRKEYWMYVLFFWLILLSAFAIFLIVLNYFPDSDTVGVIATLLPSALLIILFWPTVSLQTKRLHDIGRSGWWQLLSLIPYVGSVVLFIFYVQPSKPESNKYGPPPIAQTQNHQVEEYEQLELFMPETVNLAEASAEHRTNHRELKIVAVIIVCAALSALFYCIGSELGHEEDYAIKYEEGREAGYEKGYDQGYNDGHKDGYHEGYDSGKEIGYQNGYDDCWTSEDYTFYRENAVIVTTTGEKYHTHDCPHLESREYRYWIYNVELAKAKGYEACLDCIGIE